MNFYIVTGGSKGLGFAIGRSVLENGDTFINISRSETDDLKQLSKKHSDRFTHFEFDLSEVEKLDQFSEKLFKSITVENLDSIVLINNAGIIAPSKQIEKCSSEEIIRCYNINTIAPTILCSKFIKQFQNIVCKKVIVNISSGAGKRSIKSWSCYSGTKAAMDIFSASVGLDQVDSKYPVKVVSFAPGVVDTDMQKEIRSLNKDDFPAVENFKALKSDNNLSTPEYVADRLLTLIKDDSFEQGEITDVRMKK
jgi:benzil reductase ((S)-benzoin forming)